jgi:ankyrin repeat protein
LIAAARWGHAGIAQLLLDKYVSTEGALLRFVNAIDGDRNTALMHASKHGHLSTMRLLLDARSSHFAAVRVVELDAQNK